jgi:hypothetical protein
MDVDMFKFKKPITNEKGAALVMITISMVAIMAFAVLAIDLSIIQLAKTQLQNAADAAVLAGALELGQTNGDQAAATTEAITLAGLNIAIQDLQQPVIIGPADVTFPESKKITVVTHRTIATGDPVMLYFMNVLNTTIGKQGEMIARASANIYPVSGTNCIKPWCMPDKWDDLNNDSLYDVGEPYDPYVTGYKIPDHLGIQILIKLSSSQASPRMGWFYAVDFAPINTGETVEVGADAYREWIAYCEPYIIAIGDQLQIEPGNMIGPTAQGIGDLIDRDPNAYWDATTGTVMGSIHPTSPRVLKVALFDPTIGHQTDVQGRDYLTVVKIVVLFLEGYQNSTKNVIGRFMRQAVAGEPCPECPDGFLFTPVLTE